MVGPLIRRFGHRFARPGMALAVMAALAGVRAGSDVPRAEVARSGVWEIGHPVPIAVREGRAEFEVPAPGPGAQTLVIVSSLAKSPGPFAIRMKARPSAAAKGPELAKAGPKSAPRLSRTPTEPNDDPPGGWPLLGRTFHLMVGDGDVTDPSRYLSVQGRLRAVGRRVQVYVDERDAADVGAEVLRDVVGTFDGRIFPVAARTTGTASDIDGDGRFTVLMSSWLTRMAGGRHAVDGFVRGADLDPSLGAPFSNRCDMMYLSTTLATGPHLRTVLAHEYTHAVTSGSRIRAGASLGRPAVEEEGWLEEGLAHLVEDLHAFSRSNLDYRVSAFLSCPERYRLVVEDYFAADLFRSHGNRGGTYLFLRWCADRYGPGLLPSLIHSEHRGIANLEAATGSSFEDLYREWSAALFLAGLETGRDRTLEGFRSINPRGTFGAWELAGPRASLVIPGGADDSWSAAGTSSHFAVVKASSGGAVAIEVDGPAGADLQVTAIPLPDDLAHLDLTARSTFGPGGELRLHARISGQGETAVRLSSLSWEPLVPAADPHSPGFRRDGLGPSGIRLAFGTTDLSPTTPLDSTPIRLPGVPHGDDPLVVKIVGVDAKGRRVAGWADLLPPHPDRTATAAVPTAP